MEVTIIVTPKGNIHKIPIITFKGLPVNDSDEFIFGLENELENSVKTFSINSKKQEFNLINTLKIVCRKYTKEKTGKKTLHKYKLSKNLIEYFHLRIIITKMHISKLFIPILKNNPSEAKIKSHQLMLRVGMIKQSSAGIYSWLPLGF